jgi:glutathione S-transferase
MIQLVGQYDSPFVRRAAVALHHYRIPFKRRVLSVFQDFEEMLDITPLGKVPVLILEDGRQIFDSRAIVEYLESQGNGDLRLTPRNPADYLDMLRIEAVGIGLAEKAYERGIESARRAPGSQDPAWIARVERQIGSALAWLEQRVCGGLIFGGRLSRADLAVAVATTQLSDRQPQLFDTARWQRLEQHRALCEALPAFKAAAYSEQEALATGWRPEAG